MADNPLENAEVDLLSPMTTRARGILEGSMEYDSEVYGGHVRCGSVGSVSEKSMSLQEVSAEGEPTRYSFRRHENDDFDHTVKFTWTSESNSVTREERIGPLTYPPTPETTLEVRELGGKEAAEVMEMELSRFKAELDNKPPTPEVTKEDIDKLTSTAKRIFDEYPSEPPFWQRRVEPGTKVDEVSGGATHLHRITPDDGPVSYRYIVLTHRGPSYISTWQLDGDQVTLTTESEEGEPVSQSAAELRDISRLQKELEATFPAKETNQDTRRWRGMAKKLLGEWFGIGMDS